MYTVVNDRKYRTAELHGLEEEWKCLERLFKDAKIKGTTLLPDEDFYSLSLVDMASYLTDWMGIETDKRIWVGFDDIDEPAGIYFEDEGVHYVVVNRKHQNNRYEAAAVLAHELMHFYLLGEYNFRLEDTQANEQLTDLATIFSGLGIVVLNGFEYSSGWFMTVLGLMFGQLRVETSSMSFGYYKPKEYAKMFTKAIDESGIDYDSFSGYLLPWTRHFLPARLNASAKLNPDRSDVVRHGQRAVWKQRAIMLGILVLIAPLAFLYINWRTGGAAKNLVETGDVGASVPDSVAASLKTKKANIDSLEQDYDSCSAEAKRREPLVDEYSQSSVDSYNALVASCEATYTQYSNAIDDYNRIVDSYR